MWTNQSFADVGSLHVEKNNVVGIPYLEIEDYYRLGQYQRTVNKR
jgi:hypothetical protein